MDDAGFVGGFERLGDLARDGRRLLERKRAVGQAFFEGGAFHQLQDESRDALLLGDAVDPGDVRMIEGREDVRLALEAGTPVGVARDRVRQDLERHLPLQLQVAGAIDLAHSARPERCQNLIWAKRGAGVERHRRGAIIGAPARSAQFVQSPSERGER